MTIATYADLKAAVQDWIVRPGDTAFASNITDFVTLCEQMIYHGMDAPFQVAPFRTRAMETRSTATLNSQYSALPLDFIEMRNFQLNTDPVTALKILSPEQLDATWAGSTSGRPRNYAIVGGELQLGPSPDATYTAEMDYYKKLPALSDSNTTNAILTDTPMIYLFGTLTMAAVYMHDDTQMNRYLALYKSAIGGAQRTDDRGTWSGAVLQIRSNTGNP